MPTPQHLPKQASHPPKQASLAKIITQNGTAYAVASADGYRDLTARNIITDASIGAQLAGGNLARLLDAEAVKEADFALGDVNFAPFLPNPEKIFCIGVNYANRNEEYKDGQEAPKNPSVFIRTPDSFTAHNAPLIRPPESHQLDYEGEIVMIIGKGGRRIPMAQAENHIAGLTLGNEGTLRDWVRHAKFNVTQGKNFEKSGAIGPWMVPRAHFERFDNLAIKTTVNGEVRQNDATDCLMFPFAKIIAYLSTFTTLKAGDVIFTGTPTGAGARFDPPKYLVPGDVVEISSPSIGLLSNGIADEGG